VYAVQCVTVPLFWLTSGQLIGLKQVYAVQCVTRHTIYLQNFSTLFFIFTSLFLALSIVLIGLHILPVLALCGSLREVSKGMETNECLHSAW